MKVITLEEHCASPAFLKGPGRMLVEQAQIAGGAAARMLDALCDVGEKRIAAMDAAGIDMQVLSLTWPGTEQLGANDAVGVATEANNFMVAAVRHFPERFAAFAALPMSDPLAAVAELDRRVTQDGFKGALINGHVGERYLDDPFFSPVLERAEALGVPIYLHPTKSPVAVQDTWFKGFRPELSELLSGGAWGWHVETVLHVIRLMAGGVFDCYPKLQVIVGHLGESLSFMLLREHLDSRMTPERTGLERPFSRYLRENVHYTFSGFNILPAFLNLLLEVGVDRMMFSVDYPNSSMQEARQFLDHLPICPVDRQKIACENATRLLSIVARHW